MKNIGLIGTAKGKLGNTVFYVRKGVQCSRVYQDTVANPNTIRQKLARARMKMAGQIARRFIQGAAIGYNDQLHAGQTAYNKMVVSVMNQLSGSSPDNLTIRWEGLQLSEGVMVQPNYIGVVDNETPLKLGLKTQELKASLIEAANGIGVPTNEVGLVAVLHCPDWGTSRVYQKVYSELDATELYLDVPASWQGMNVRPYLFFKQLLPSGLEEIATQEIPWRFPSKSSPTIALDEVEVL